MFRQYAQKYAYIQINTQKYLTYIQKYGIMLVCQKHEKKQEKKGDVKNGNGKALHYRRSCGISATEQANAHALKAGEPAEVPVFPRR